MDKKQEEILNDPEQLWKLCCWSISTQKFLVKNTPEWQPEERASELWLWCTTNKDKYDSSKGMVSTWVKSVSRRIIDSYRKYKCGRHYYEEQFPETRSEWGEPLCYQDLLPAPEPDELYNDQDWSDLQKALTSLTPDNLKIILYSVDDLDDATLAKEMGISVASLQGRRCYSKKYIIELLESMGYTNGVYNG